MNTTILRNFLLPLGDLLFGQKMISRLKFLEKAQWWDIEQISTWQNRELSKLIKTTYTEVPFYHNIFDQAGAIPANIRTADDLLRIPIVTKDMLRTNYPNLTTRPTGQKTYESSTSGSTGKNFYIQEDAYTAGWYRATFLLALEWAGWSIGEPHLQTGMTLDRSLDRKLKDWILRCHYVSAYRLDDNHLEKILSTLEKYHLEYLWGYPGSIYYLAKFAKSQGWNRPLKSVVSWGDMLFPHYRRTIEETFNTKVFDTYGCAEGFHISAQCEYGNYHIHSFDVIVETLGDDNQPAQKGAPGNIVITRLHPGPMPFIRYLIGDVGILSNQEKCRCGRWLPCVESILGRNTDVVITPSGNRLIVHFFTGILEHFPEIDTFQIVQENLSSIVLCIVPNARLTDHKLDKIKQALKEKGADLDIRINVVDEIPFSTTGKNRFIISNIKL